jgi:hypothetical protein
MRRVGTATIVALMLCRLAISQGPRRISPVGDLPIDRRMALVVGNSNYQGVPLRNPGNDASAVAAALQRLNFQVTVALNTTKRQLDEATEKFASGLKAGDLALFYYSGHGAQLNQENFLIPVDFQGSSAADLRYNAFPAGQIRDRLEESSARVRVMILDACRDNPFRGVRGGAGGLASMTPAVGTLIAYATAENSNAGEQYGLYTKYLLTALNMPGLSLKQIFEQAKDNVFTQGGRKQLPYVYDGIVGDVMLTGGAAPAAATASAPSGGVDPASLAWERAKDSRNRAMLEAIVQEFPDSPYARLARVELAGLTSGPKITGPPAASPVPANPGGVKLAFEQASIKLVAPMARGSYYATSQPSGGPGTSDPEQFSWKAVTLQTLMAFAHGVSDGQVTGPGWIVSEFYSVAANVPAGTTKEQFDLMLQNLLSERFRLAFHEERKVAVSRAKVMETKLVIDHAEKILETGVGLAGSTPEPKTTGPPAASPSPANAGGKGEVQLY